MFKKQPLNTQQGREMLKALLHNCVDVHFLVHWAIGCWLESVGCFKTLLSHLSNALKPTSCTDSDAQLTVVDFKSHAGDLLCYYHHGPGDKNRLKMKFFYYSFLNVQSFYSFTRPIFDFFFFFFSLKLLLNTG